MVRINKMTQETSEVKHEMRAMRLRLGLMREEMRAAVGETRQFTLRRNKRLRQDLSKEVKEELVAVRQKGCTGVIESMVDGRPCPVVVDTGAAKTVIKEEVVAAQHLHVSDWQL
ncbi:hypothetical protein E2C01_090775 [Portunus trituberculatus]|uniref:Uncharacterized protein n=1 Tax=Portunus trituberculatus TaxID=210409 RepID=A0A5B7JRA2_PORTR|nr:hypothetical protein [Portunus trituberculatus]